MKGAEKERERRTKSEITSILIVLSDMRAAWEALSGGIEENERRLWVSVS